MNRTGSAAFIAAMIFIICASEGTEHLRTDAMYWDVISTDHFTVVHPRGLLEKAREAAFYLEQGYSRISADLDTEIKREIPVILYRSRNTFEQNNIYGGAVPESLGGFAETYRNRIVMPICPSAKKFKYILQHELTHIFEYEALFPRRIPSFYIIRFPFYPQWFMEGLSEYESDFDYAYRRMTVRDMALDDKLMPMYKLFGFSHLNPHETVPAYKQSGEFIHYLSLLDPQGPRILLKTFKDHMPWKISSVMRKAFSSDYRKLDKEFRAYLKKQAEKETQNRKEPPAGYRLLDSEGRYYYTFETDAVWSPDGKRIAFLSDMRDKTTLYIADNRGRKTETILPFRLNFTIESVHRGKGGSTAWTPDGHALCFIGEWANRDYIYRYDLHNKKFRRIDPECEGIRDLNAVDENRLIYSGIRNGRSDLYICDILTKKVTRITNDEYDDSCPRWNDKLKVVVYSSERNGQNDLILINMKADKPGETQNNITNSPANEINPCWNKAGDRVFFVSDSQGFYDMYMMEVYENRIYRQTYYKGGVFQPVLSPEENEILFSYYRHGAYTLYKIPVRVDKGDKADLSPVKEVKENLGRFKNGTAGPDMAKSYSTDFGWDSLLPLGVFNWGQVGDTFDNHEISGSLYPGFTGNETFVEGNLVYWNKISRFDIGIGVEKEYWNDYDTDEQEEDLRIFLQARYPFDAYRSITGGVISGQRQEYEDSEETEDKSRFGVFARATHDNRLYRGLSFVRGQMLSLGGELYPGDESDLEEERYGYIFGSFEQAFTFGQDHTLYINASGDLTKGRDRPELDLASVVRGYERDEYEGYGRIGGTLEYRFPIYRDGNYSVLGHYLLLKDIRGFAFIDIGAVSVKDTDDFIADITAFDIDTRKSAGAGVRIDFYGMQKAPFALRVGFAHILDKDNDDTSLFFNIDISF